MQGRLLGRRAHPLQHRAAVPGQAPPNTSRLPAFWQIDLRADKRFVLDRSTWDLYLELGNATLNQQVTALRALDNANATEPVGFRIVLPSIGVHVEW